MAKKNTTEENVQSNELTLEENFKQLEEIIKNLESNSLSLEDSFKQYEQGVKLIANCNNQIDKVEKQIIILKGNEDIDEQ